VTADVIADSDNKTNNKQQVNNNNGTNGTNGTNDVCGAGGALCCRYFNCGPFFFRLLCHRHGFHVWAQFFLSFQKLSCHNGILLYYIQKSRNGTNIFTARGLNYRTF
jgi:hypothetical protein